MGWNRYLIYLWYVVRHKFYVALECARHGVILRGILHDVSKFRPDEFFAYANYFNPPAPTHWDGMTVSQNQAQEEDRRLSTLRESAMNVSWMFHQRRNDHHWQAWVLRLDDGGTLALEMPERAIREMLCDWRGAGRALGYDKPGEVSSWYAKNKENMVLNPKTRARVEELMKEWGY